MAQGYRTIRPKLMSWPAEVRANQTIMSQEFGELTLSLPGTPE